MSNFASFIIDLHNPLGNFFINFVILGGIAHGCITMLTQAVKLALVNSEHRARLYWHHRQSHGGHHYECLDCTIQNQ